MTIQIVAYTQSICNANPKEHLFAQRPQIRSIPGASPKERRRYRVLFGEQILGDRLALDEAIAIAKGEGAMIKSSSSEEDLTRRGGQPLNRVNGSRLKNSH